MEKTRLVTSSLVLLCDRVTCSITGKITRKTLPARANQSINQPINIRLLRHDKMQANNRKQKGNTVSKKKACLDDKPKN